MNIRPLADNVLIEYVEQSDKTNSGIYIPDTAEKKSQEGRVAAVGTGRVPDNGTTLAMSVKAGDRVLYKKYTGSEIKIDGKEYLIVSEKDVLAIVDKVDPKV